MRINRQDYNELETLRNKTKELGAMTNKSSAMTKSESPIIEKNRPGTFSFS